MVSKKILIRYNSINYIEVIFWSECVMKEKLLCVFIMVLLFPFSVSAQRGCCSHHGGVAGCNANGRQICNDGTLSPSCTCTPPVYYGCTDRNAKNYNVNATRDDGSCQYEVLGCTDRNAKNYNVNATKDDRNCQFEKVIEEDEIILYKTVEQNTKKYNSVKKVIQKGKTGNKKVTYTIVVTNDGKEVAREKMKEVVINQPIVEQIEWIPEKKNNYAVWLFLIILFGWNIYVLKKDETQLFLLPKIVSYKNLKKCIFLFLYFIFAIPLLIDFVYFILRKMNKIVRNNDSF